MSRDGKRRRGLSYEDRVLWTHVTKAIKPLRDETKNVAGEIAEDCHGRCGGKTCRAAA
jgi:hypothetical protein